MAASSLAPQLTDILEAIGHIRSELAGVSIDAFDADWRNGGWSNAASKLSPRRAVICRTR